MAAASTSSDSVSICGVLRGDAFEDPVPEHHAVALRVGFGDRGDALLAIALHRQVKREAHDPLDAAAREDAGLDGDLLRLVLVDKAAHLRVLAFGVFAHHHEIDLAALGPRQGRLHAGIEIGGTHVRVLVEGAADGQQQPVQRGVVGDFGMAHRAQEDRVAGLQQVDRAGGHHPAPAEIVLGAPFEILKREAHIVLFGGGFQNPFSLRDDFAAHAVAGDYTNGESLHGQYQL